jgi:hypothetical protein
MDLEELQTLSRSGEPLSAACVPSNRRAWALAYNDMLFRFLENVTLARHSLDVGEAVEVDLATELRLMARMLPSMRQRVEALAERGPVAWRRTSRSRSA